MIYMTSKTAKAKWRETRTGYIKTFIDDIGYSIHWFSPYHCRVDNMLDLWPTNGRYQILDKGGYGDWHTLEDLYKILQENHL